MVGVCDLPTDGEGRLYHIACGPGDIAPYVLACANPGRAGVVAQFLEAPQLKGIHREYVVYTGTYRGSPVSVVGTGIGAPAAAIAVVEMAQCQPNATFIRIGTCGALQPEIESGHLIITDKVIRDENTTNCYADPDLEIRSDPSVLSALEQAAHELGFTYHVGPTCTTADFYAGQGRLIEGFPTRDPGKVERLSRQGALNFEMEMSVFLTLAAVSSYSLRAGGVTVALCNRLEGTWASPEDIPMYEERCILTGLKAVEILYGRSR
ncbi:MAG: nucleoside phosphorylase [Deltaproteobacteria bacterium]|nr:nucleoside phosphorylase [Deltaproteobacteria bacterium]